MGNRGHCPLIPMSPSSPIFPSPFYAVNRNVCQLLPWQPAQAGSRSLLMLAGHPAEVDNEGRERLILECRTGFGTYGWNMQVSANTMKCVILLLFTYLFLSVNPLQRDNELDLDLMYLDSITFKQSFISPSLFHTDPASNIHILCFHHCAREKCLCG